MRKIISVSCVLSAILTSILIICTFLTSYQFFYVGQIFYSYAPIQLGGALTMALLAIRFWGWESGEKKIIYSLVSLGISFVLIFSMTFVK